MSTHEVGCLMQTHQDFCRVRRKRSNVRSNTNPREHDQSARLRVQVASKSCRAGLRLNLDQDSFRLTRRIGRVVSVKSDSRTPWSQTASRPRWLTPSPSMTARGFHLTASAVAIRLVVCCFNCHCAAVCFADMIAADAVFFAIGNVPAPVTYTGAPSVVSGRVTSLAVSNVCGKISCVALLGAAGGGVWKTSSALANTPAGAQSATVSTPTLSAPSSTIQPMFRFHRVRRHWRSQRSSDS